MLTVRAVRLDLEPSDYLPEDVRATRAMLRMSQAVFARFLGVDPSTVRSWEQGKRKPAPIARRFMDEIRHDPQYWFKRIRQEARGR